MIYCDGDVEWQLHTSNIRTSWRCFGVAKSTEISSR